MLRFCGSESTSYASLICLNFFSAAALLVGFLSCGPRNAQRLSAARQGCRKRRVEHGRRRMRRRSARDAGCAAPTQSRRGSLEPYRVPLHSELAIRLLELIFGCGLGHAANGVASASGAARTRRRGASTLHAPQCGVVVLRVAVASCHGVQRGAGASAACAAARARGRRRRRCACPARSGGRPRSRCWFASSEERARVWAVFWRAFLGIR